MTVAIAVVLVAGACSSDDKTTTTPAATAASEDESKAPEEIRASAAAVAAGLRQIRDVTAQTAQAVDSDKAKLLNNLVEPAWEHIEGTVKANDSDVYITFEDSFAELGKAVEAGDSAKAQQAATTIATTVTAYLEKYPG